MPIESPAVLRRLLDLFPAKTIKEFEQADEEMTKAEAIAAVADGCEQQEVLSFVTSHFGRLHQHVYLLERDQANVGGFDATALLEGPFEVVTNEGDEQQYYYMETLTHHLVVEPPLERQELRFAWPLKLVVAPDHLRIHFTIMSKSPQAYVGDDRNVVRSRPEPKERDLLEIITTSPGIYGCPELDLNKGVKALWDADEFDAPSVQYKRARATSKDVMDEHYTVKQHDPDLYQELQAKPLLGTSFTFMDEAPCIEHFFVNPTQGFLRFRRFSSSSECVDALIGRILEAN